MRVLRSANDKRRWDADDFRRYRCRSDSCSWQGLLRVSGLKRIPPQPKAQASILVRAGLVAAAALLAAGLAFGMMEALQVMLDP